MLGGAFFILHFCLPWRVESPKEVLIEDGEMESTSVTRVHEPQYCLEAMGTNLFNRLSVFGSALLMLVFIGGAVRSRRPDALIRAAGVLAGVSAIGAFSTAVFVAAILLVAFIREPGFLFSEMIWTVLSFLSMCYMAVSAWLAWRSAKLSSKPPLTDLKYRQCHVSIILTGMPLIELFIFFGPRYSAYPAAFGLGFAGWACMLAGASSLSRHARAQLKEQEIPAH
jgi:hypothetical protein